MYSDKSKIVIQYFPLASFAKSYRVTDEAFIAET